MPIRPISTRRGENANAGRRGDCANCGERNVFVTADRLCLPCDYCRQADSAEFLRRQPRPEKHAAQAQPGLFGGC